MIINFEVISRKCNLGSDRSFVSHFDFLEIDKIVRQGLTWCFIAKSIQGWGLVTYSFKLALGIIGMIPLLIIIIYLQMIISLILSFIRLVRRKNLVNDLMFMCIVIFIHYMFIFPLVLNYGDINWLNLYIFKFPNWIIDFMMVGRSGYY